jgi:hypothetical protein
MCIMHRCELYPLLKFPGYLQSVAMAVAWGNCLLNIGQYIISFDAVHAVADMDLLQLLALENILY